MANDALAACHVAKVVPGPNEKYLPFLVFHCMAFHLSLAHAGCKGERN